MDIIITANSPGEVAAWVKPAAAGLKKRYSESVIYVFLPPCMFASGSEKSVLMEYSDVDYVYDKCEYLKYILLGIKPQGFTTSDKGIVIFLGGDLFHAVILGRKNKFPVIAYTEGVYNWDKHIYKFMVPDTRTEKNLLEKGASKSEIEVIGNLMLDAVEVELDLKQLNSLADDIEKNFIITVFPGSRPAEVEYMLPFFLDTLRKLKKNSLEFMLSGSPFVNIEIIKTIFNQYCNDRGIDGFIINKEDNYILEFAGRKIKIFTNLQYSLMQVTDLALTIPGTNNLELAYFGTPMIVLLPLNKPEDIPLEGVVGLIGEIPYLGKLLKQKLVPKIAARTDYVALINIIAEKRIAPEIRGIISPEDLVERVNYYLENKKELKAMQPRLKEAAGSKGAVDRLRRIVEETIIDYY
ncbi:MAG: hypothetical protein ACOCRZ_00325 [Halothermotrichaceae bacterium]